MADSTAIEWTDATVNFWWGCTKVGPGCDHCYAETWDNRTGGAHWGHGTPRRWIKGAANTLTRLNRQGGKRVFIQSMSDLFDNEVETAWFLAAWLGIVAATDCRIQIVTKRISMVEKRLAEIGAKGWPRHAGLMITVCNQTEADRDIPRLLALKAKLGIPWVGLSMEPLLGPVDLTEIAVLRHDLMAGVMLDVLRGTGGLTSTTGGKIDWVIVGGESGPGARPMHPDWARSLRDQCQAALVPFFFKQWGEWGHALHMVGVHAVSAATAKSGHWAHPHRYRIHGGPEDGQCFESLPEDHLMLRVGKSRAGRLLDGREWREVPG